MRLLKIDCMCIFKHTIYELFFLITVYYASFKWHCFPKNTQNAILFQQVIFITSRFAFRITFSLIDYIDFANSTIHHILIVVVLQLLLHRLKVLYCRLMMGCLVVIDI